MQAATPDTAPYPNLLDHEHQALLRGYGQAQVRCSALLREQAQRIEKLEAELIRSRAAAIVRQSALAWERADRQALEQAMPGLPRRFELARRVEALLARVQDLIHHQQRSALNSRSGATADSATADSTSHVAQHPASGLAAGPLRAGLSISPQDELAPSASLETHLEASLAAADLVICQTGCVSHGDYWRVEDHCRRTGKTCMLVDQPEALSIVRVHAHADHETPDLFKP